MSHKTKVINGTRHYNCEGKYYPSVTAILSATKPQRDRVALANWKQKIGKEAAQQITQQASRKGISLHQCCEAYLLGKEVDISPELQPLWQSIEGTLNQITDVDYLEQFVWCDRYQYAGVLDCFATYQGVPNTLIDFKSARYQRKWEWVEDYCLQTVAYAIALEERVQLKTNQIALLIALPTEPAQVFLLDENLQNHYEKLWLKRVQDYYRNRP